MAGLFDHFEKYDVQATRAEARKLGLAEGRAESLIETCQEFGCTKEDTCQRLMNKMSLTREEAMKYMAEYWKET